MLRKPTRQVRVRSAASRLRQAEQLFRDYCSLTPYPRSKRIARTFDSFEAFERWKRAQRSPWY